MSQIKSWSTTPASNNAAAPDGWPEGQAPSSVNDCAREMMASIRTWYEDVEWRNLGHTPTRTGNTTFTIPTDVTAIYVTDRRIRCTDSSTLYGDIVSSSYSAPNTTITVILDSGNLSASLTAVALGPDVTNDPIHVSGVKDAVDISSANTFTAAQTFTNNIIMDTGVILGDQASDIASGATVDLSTATGNFVIVTHSSGTTSITSLGVVQAGAKFTIEFSISGGTLNLTYNATSMKIHGNSDIAPLTNGAIMEVLSLGGGNWKILNYSFARTPANTGKVASTVYQNLTGRDLTVTGTLTSGQTNDGFYLLIGTANPPTLEIGRSDLINTSGHDVITYPLPHGYYWKFVPIGTSTITIIEG